MLTFLEEIVLLALGDKSGEFVTLPPMALDKALAGAALLELAFQNRIDTDLTNLIMVSDEPTGDLMLNSILSQINAAPGIKDAKYWVGVISADGEKLREATLAKLVSREILEQNGRKFFRVPEKRKPAILLQEELSVRERIRAVIVDGEVPTPRDVVVISLAGSCQLLLTVFSDAELLKYSSQVAEISKMEFIGQAVSASIAEVQEAVMRAVLYSLPFLSLATQV
ncbi:MAG: GPP34 family phosphoprotein [Verrucomicrobia bacterium]|nr:GPP34 family phosphoprotein [Verrucomicrobiota bacterium]